MAIHVMPRLDRGIQTADRMGRLQDCPVKPGNDGIIARVAIRARWYQIAKMRPHP
jgi:hypothetical protein